MLKTFFEFGKCNLPVVQSGDEGTSEPDLSLTLSQHSTSLATLWLRVS
jgi:hypothetical protein